ncbi:hypothetical protein M5K25_018462 [Dendrobium thyrsiflorum]|uniref:Uncharacterized protein n=1 Tax=Dendrobium thyrsiflorum TaxID=117978 RepID=A0ABD0UIP1_DENTH
MSWSNSLTKPTKRPSNKLHPRGSKDPDVDHGFLYDEQGRVDILRSPFFDVTFGNDRTADEYVDRIIYQLTLAIEDQIPQGRWYIISHPSTSPDLDPAPATTTTRGVLLPTNSTYFMSLRSVTSGGSAENTLWNRHSKIKAKDETFNQAPAPDSHTRWSDHPATLGSSTNWHTLRCSEVERHISKQSSISSKPSRRQQVNWKNRHHPTKSNGFVRTQQSQTQQAEVRLPSGDRLHTQATKSNTMGVGVGQCGIDFKFGSLVHTWEAEWKIDGSRCRASSVTRGEISTLEKKTQQKLARKGLNFNPEYHSDTNLIGIN